jgi:hypothetical protein
MPRPTLRGIDERDGARHPIDEIGRHLGRIDESSARRPVSARNTFAIQC